MDAILLLKATMLLSGALLGARLLRRSPAAVRHYLWTAAFAALLALPLVAPILPALHLPLAGLRSMPRSAEGPTPHTIPIPVEDRRTAQENRAEPTAAVASSTGSTAHGVPDAPGAIELDGVLAAIWLTGAIAAAAALLLALLRVHRLQRASEPLADPDWHRAADALGACLGLRRTPRLLVSTAVSTPMAAGVWRPVVFLPAGAAAWSVEQRDLVLAHEIAHLASRDPLRVIAARLAAAVYWFHPLVWLAARQAAMAREEACDEAVLALGTRPSTYARVLLDLAESMQPAAPPLAALPMIQPSLLERRLMAILSANVRPVRTRSLLIPPAGIALLTVVVAAVSPAARASAPAEPVRPFDVVNPIATAAVPQRETAVDRACELGNAGGSFRGRTSTSEVGGRIVIHEQVGTRGSDRVIQQRFGDLRLCVLAEDVGPDDRTERPSDWPDKARRVVLEARRGAAMERLEIARQAAGGFVATWQVDATQRPFDAAVEEWRDGMLAVFDTTWELAMLRGEVSSLRGQISSIRGEESSLRGQISSLMGEVSSMRGRASAIQGEESSLRGQISSIRGQLSSLHGAISSERGSISALNAHNYRADAAERARIEAQIKEHNSKIASLESEIRAFDADAKAAAVEREIAALDTTRKVAAIEAEIRAFDLDGKVGAIERRIAELDVQGKTSAIERQIEALDAERKGRQLVERREIELKRLEAAIAALR